MSEYTNYIQHYGVAKAEGAPGVGTGNWRRSTAKMEKYAKKAEIKMNKAAKAYFRSRRDSRLAANPFIWITGLRPFAMFRAGVQNAKGDRRTNQARKLAQKGREVYKKLEEDMKNMSPYDTNDEYRKKAEELMKQLSQYKDPEKFFVPSNYKGDPTW